MSRTIVVLLLALTPAALTAQAVGSLSPDVRQYVIVPEASVALTNVRVVDGRGGPPMEGATIVIENGKIASVGPAAQAKVPTGARTIDLTGHTVIPGLVGMHNHTFYTTRGRSVQLQFSAPRLYLGSGLTTVRTTGGTSPYHEINMKRDIDNGQIPGPRMHLTGPYLTGAGGAATMAQISSPEEARRIVNYWADEGVTWFKAYTDISRETLGAAIREAHKRGLKFTGHLCSVSFREAVRLGIDNLEHGLFTNSDYVPNRTPDHCSSDMRDSLLKVAIDGPEVQQTIREMVNGKVAMSSTLAVYELSYPDRPPLEDRVLEALAPEAREEDPVHPEGNVATSGTVDDAGVVSSRAGVRACLREGWRTARCGRRSHGNGWGAAGVRRPAQLRVAARGGVLADRGNPDHDPERRPNPWCRCPPRIDHRRQVGRPGRYPRQPGGQQRRDPERDHRVQRRRGLRLAQTPRLGEGTGGNPLAVRIS